MPLPRRGFVLLSFALVIAAWIIVTAISGADSGLLYLAPAVVLCAPLLIGRYVGDEQLAALAGRVAARRSWRTAHVPMPRGHVPLMERGSRLVASSLAKRPPPMLAALPLP